MLKFLAGVATGYVLGAQAGRERYDQIARTCRQVADHPAVQGAAGVVRAKITEVTGRLQEERDRRAGPRG